MENAGKAVIAIALILIVFASGCTKKSISCAFNSTSCKTDAQANAKVKCSSEFCYCQECEKGNWTKVNKTLNRIVTVLDCADYCEKKNRNSTKKDQGYAFVCSDIVAMSPPKCACPTGTRCCMQTQTYGAIGNGSFACTATDSYYESCLYYWMPDPYCE